MIDATLNIQDAASPELQRLIAEVENPRALNAEISVALERQISRHIRENKVPLPNALGAPSTGFWQKAINSILASSNRAAATVSIRARGVALLFSGGIVKPTEKKALTIPIDPAAHGKKVGDFKEGSIFRIPAKSGDPDTVGILARASGRGKNKQIIPLYVLRTRAKIRADKSILPTDARMLDAATTAASNYFWRQSQ